MITMATTMTLKMTTRKAHGARGERSTAVLRPAYKGVHAHVRAGLAGSSTTRQRYIVRVERLVRGHGNQYRYQRYGAVGMVAHAHAHALELAGSAPKTFIYIYIYIYIYI
jgi:hypothetical protein